MLSMERVLRLEGALSENCHKRTFVCRSKAVNGVCLQAALNLDGRSKLDADTPCQWGA